MQYYNSLSHRCECDEYHTGVHCEHLIDNPCNTEPCDQGSCKKTDENDRGYVCSCFDRYFGEHCETGKLCNFDISGESSDLASGFF